MVPRSQPPGESGDLACCAERRSEPRQPVAGCLWLIDNRTSVMLRCRCVEISPNGMRLRLPASYSVQIGQRYQLTSHLPGQTAPPGMDLMLSRQAEVVRAQTVPADDGYDLEIGVALWPTRKPALPAEDARVSPAWL